MARINLELTMKRIYSYTAPSYGYGYETRYIYTMEDNSGKQYVWKTTSAMGILAENNRKDGYEYNEKTGKYYDFLNINNGDIVKLSATIKEESEYNGVPQTVLTRVKVLERVYDASEEIARKRESKKADQIASLTGEDFIWNMPYRQYKEHYSDCETVIDSFDDHEGRYPATISVIIREGRLKASGVRGQHYSGYEFFFIDENGEKSRVCYRAISEETAMKHLYRDFPEAKDVTPGEIYDYMATGEFVREHFW